MDSYHAPEKVWHYPDKQCKVCGSWRAWQDLNSDDVCIPCHLALVDESESEHSLLYIVSDGKEGK